MKLALIVFLLSYLWGSILWSALLCKLKGQDIFSLGSGNAGATNVRRVLGPGWSKLIFVLDFLKGALASLMPLIFLGEERGFSYALLAFLGAILGHSFSVFYKFKGGKAVATTMGGLCVLAPGVLLGGTVVWLGVFYSLRYVSVASMAFGLSLPLFSLLSSKPRIFQHFSFLLMALILAFHRKNLKQLWHGKEKKL